MALGVHRTRIALATFDAGRGLGAALAHLKRAGLLRTQMGIAARASVVAALARDAPIVALGTDDVAPLFVELARLPVVLGSENFATENVSTENLNRDSILVSGWAFWQRLGAFNTGAAEPLVTAPWMAPQLRLEVADRIRLGAALLGVSAVDLDQQKLCTQILLDHSSHRVHTHEFVL